MKHKRIPAIITLAQLLFLSGMIVFHASKLATASRIMLKTVPCDPVSIFRGRYVNLRYEISTLPVSLLKDCGLRELHEGAELFVLLEKDGDYWNARGVYLRLAPGHTRGVYLRGRLSDHSLSYRTPAKILRLDYGIESFFLSETAAAEVDAAHGPPGNRRMATQERQELLAQLDPESRRIITGGLMQGWFATLKKELEIWRKGGLIDEAAKENIYHKYAQAKLKAEEIEKKINLGAFSGGESLSVEVAVDKNGYGSCVGLFLKGKEYR